MRRVCGGVGTGDKRPNKVYLNIEAARPFSPCPYKELLVDPDTPSSLAAAPGVDRTPLHLTPHLLPPPCRHYPPAPVSAGAWKLKGWWWLFGEGGFKNHVWWNILK